MKREDLFAIIENRAKAYLGTDQGLEFAKELTSDLFMFLLDGEVLDVPGPFMPFGQFEGMAIRYVPENYLRWITAQDFVKSGYVDLRNEILMLIVERETYRHWKKINEKNQAD